MPSPLTRPQFSCRTEMDEHQHESSVSDYPHRTNPADHVFSSGEHGLIELILLKSASTTNQGEYDDMYFLRQLPETHLYYSRHVHNMELACRTVVSLLSLNHHTHSLSTVPAFWKTLMVNFFPKLPLPPNNSKWAQLTGRQRFLEVYNRHYRYMNAYRDYEEMSRIAASAKEQRHSAKCPILANDTVEVEKLVYKAWKCADAEKSQCFVLVEHKNDLESWHPKMIPVQRQNATEVPPNP